MDTPLLQLCGVHKRFPGVHALQDISLHLNAGEVLALLGENGAGKSTLIKVLTGVYPTDGGAILAEGRSVVLRSPIDAQRLGIACIYQEFSLFPDLSVAENILLSQPPVRGMVRLDRAAMIRQAGGLLQELEIGIDPAAPAGRLSNGEKKLVEVARALSRQSRILILDEPTASLEQRESARLQTLIRRLRGQGKAIIFVSHRLDEVLAVADRMVVLRDGQAVGALTVAEATGDRLVSLIVGRRLEERTAGSARQAGAEAVAVDGLQLRPAAAPIDLAVREGEVVGLTGLLGSGCTDAVRTVLGEGESGCKALRLGGKPAAVRHPAAAVARDVGFVPEDRQREGILPHLSVEWNIALACLGRVSTWGFVSRRRLRRMAQEYIQQLGIRAASPAVEMRTLSGGNQQKAILARWLARGVRVLALEEPTHGVDVGAKAEIHRLLHQFADDGGAILLYSTELPELCGLADQVLVLRDGGVVAKLSRSEATEEVILAHAARVRTTANAVG